MSRRSVPLLPGNRDGTSQRSRRLAALDPGYAAIDERTTADLLRFVQRFSEQLRFYEAGADADAFDLKHVGTWANFAQRSDISIADIVAYMADPSRFEGERARWLGRPHFTLLLAFLTLFGHARDHLNGFTRRHLDYFYRELLRMVPEGAVADRAAVVFGLAPGVTELRLPAGTELRAGRDAGGAARIYRTERELVVNRATVASLRSVFVDRRVTGIPDVRLDRSLTAGETLDRMLRLALGSPKPSDPVAAWNGHAIDTAFLAGLRGPLAFSGDSLFLLPHELRSLMRWVRQRNAGSEWAEINRLLGVVNPANPRDFEANLKDRVGELDFDADGLPQIDTVDDLYAHRTDPAVRAYIEQRLAAIGFDNFVALMRIKLRVDAEWAEINRLLERMGRRQRGVLTWSLPQGKPTDFAGNLALALEGKWPPPWPLGANSIDAYEALLRGLEIHLSLTVERLATLAAFAEAVRGDPASERNNWTEIDRILAEAHRENVRARRRDAIAKARNGSEDRHGLEASASFVLGETKSTLSWTGEAKQRLAQHLDAADLELLDRFWQSLAQPLPLHGFGWADADRLLELAWRSAECRPEPVAQKVEVRNVYACDDATEETAGAAALSAWKTFGRRPLAADAQHPQGALIGWALRSPLLSLSEGKRTLTVTLGLRDEGLDLPGFLAALGLGATDRSGARLAAALNDALIIEVSTAKKWLKLGVANAKLAGGKTGDDYWSLRGMARALPEDRPALQLRIDVDASCEALAPLGHGSEPWPTLRLRLAPRWDEAAKEWHILYDALAPLVLAAIHLKVEVEGLAGLRLQQDDRVLDARKPFEPFGRSPVAGARLYLEHPELVRTRLDRLTFDVEWMGLPASLTDYYFNYPGLTASDVFTTQIALVDRALELELANLGLFADKESAAAAERSLAIEDVPAALQKAAPAYVYDNRSDLPPASDLRLASRYFRWELNGPDFGHSVHASLAAAKAREFAVAVASGSVKTDADAAKYRVEAPYTPMLKKLTAAYTASVELDPRAPATASDHAVLHVHPFGTSPIDPEAPSLLPRYDAAGELYVGLRDLRAPQRLTLLLQLAEGTADPDADRETVGWSYLTGDRFADLSQAIVHDSTRGLTSSGIIELALPAATTGERLPPELYWLRVAVARNPKAVCDTLAVRAQAAAVCFDDRDNSATHYEQPLPAGTINRLVESDARIAVIEQPYTSCGGRPPEKPEHFDTRVSERLRHKQRALSPWDYERLVLWRFPQVYKAKCLPQAGTVDVVVVPDQREVHPCDPFAPRAPANLLAEIQAYLAERAPTVAEIRVRNARYVSVQVRLAVRFRSGADEGYAQRRLNDDLIRFLSPWAFDAGAEITLGGRIYANSIIDFVDRLDYVDYVAEPKLFRSVDGINFALVPPVTGDYHIATDRPDEVLAAATQHYFDIIPMTGFKQASFTGINYTRVELDFIVG